MESGIFLWIRCRSMLQLPHSSGFCASSANHTFRAIRSLDSGTALVGSLRFVRDAIDLNQHSRRHAKIAAHRRAHRIRRDEAAGIDSVVPVEQARIA